MKSPLKISITDEYLDDLVARLDLEGLVCVEDSVEPASLKRWQLQLNSHLEKHGNRYFSIIQPWQDAGSAFCELAQDGNFKKLLSGLTCRGAPDRDAEGPIYNVLRVVAGTSGAEKSMMFHYDASVITVLIPLQIPSGGPDEAGDLVAFPNMRPIRSSSLLNTIEKIWVQNPLFRRRMAKRIRQRSDDRNVFRLRPGNIYLFWGYRTLHANLSCKPNSLRATLLFHHGDPHLGSMATRVIKWSRRLRERRNLRSDRHA